MQKTCGAMVRQLTFGIIKVNGMCGGYYDSCV
jgi:hypothetical protein